MVCTCVFTENEDCCGTMKYDYNKYTCCNVSLQAYVNFASPACCGEQPYDENTHWCDDSVWPHVVTDLHFPKCAGERYDTANYVCCDDEKGIVIEKKPITLPNIGRKMLQKYP